MSNSQGNDKIYDELRGYFPPEYDLTPDELEKEIDFMSMNGINMPLCAVGIEGIWYHTLMEFGFSDEEARSFIVGPAFLAWQNMGNIEGHGGTVSRAWIDNRIELGKKIIDRVVSLDMHPIQQGFSGFVPTALQEKYPNSNIILKKQWCNLKATAQLDPTDPLFWRLGRRFMDIQSKLFGLYGFYATDPFHESRPPIDGEEYLHQVGKTISSLYKEIDENYVWIMMAWSVRKGIVEAVSKERLLLLDLNGAKYRTTDNFWGYPFIVGTLHNFGGRIKLHGDVKRLVNNPYIVAKDQGADVIGAGLFMEGINQNPMFYDLAFDMLTRSNTVDINEWIKKYVYRRYKTDDINAIRAWDILLKNVYVEEGEGVYETSSIICARPAIKVKKSGPNAGFVFNYDNKLLADVIELLLSVESTTDGYEFDLMDITRQYLSNYAYFLYQSVAESFLNKDKENFASLSEQFLSVLMDVDKLLKHRDEYSLEKWIADARKCAAESEEQALFEYNASMLITVWGNEDAPKIFDYSWREWSGLIEQFYVMRWKFFFGKLCKFLDEETEYTEEGVPLAIGREAWRANELYSEMADKELEWVYSQKQFEAVQCGALRDYVAEILYRRAYASELPRLE